MSTHLLTHSPIPQPAKKLRPCLSPSRIGRPLSPDTEYLATSRSPSVASDSSAASSAYTEFNGQLVKRKCVRWQGEIDGCAVTSYFATYSATEYDRTPLAPPSEAERACALPARGSRCLTMYNSDEDDDDEDDEVDDAEESDYAESVPQPRSPFASPADSDDEGCDGDAGDEWSECFARRRMMFARMCPLGDDAHPQFEGYRSLSSTLADLLSSVGCDDDGVATPRVGSSTPRDVDDDLDLEDDAHSDVDAPFPVTGFRPFTTTNVFERLREGSTDSDAIGTPSLISSADSDGECSRLASPRGSAVDFLPSTSSSFSSPASSPYAAPPKAAAAADSDTSPLRTPTAAKFVHVEL